MNMNATSLKLVTDSDPTEAAALAHEAKALAEARAELEAATAARDAHATDASAARRRVAEIDEAVRSASSGKLDGLLTERALLREKAAVLDERYSAAQSGDVRIADEKFASLQRAKRDRETREQNAKDAAACRANEIALADKIAELVAVAEARRPLLAQHLGTLRNLNGENAVGAPSVADIFRAYSARQAPGQFTELRLPVGR